MRFRTLTWELEIHAASDRTTGGRRRGLSAGAKTAGPGPLPFVRLSAFRGRLRRIHSRVPERRRTRDTGRRSGPDRLSPAARRAHPPAAGWTRRRLLDHARRRHDSIDRAWTAPTRVVN